MHYSSLHSINKAIVGPTLPRPLWPALCGLLSCSVVFLVAFPQNAFNSILFQFNCHIAGCIAGLPSARLGLSAYLCRSARLGSRDQTQWPKASGCRQTAGLIISPALSILYNIFALIYGMCSTAAATAFLMHFEFFASSFLWIFHKQC